MRTGKVYLIGAGPGDPKLITLRGKEYLERADVVIYDYLAPKELLETARPGAEIIFAGKKGKNPPLTQEAINRLIIEKARAGRIVARLKGGDPFIFGRGGEEAEAFVQAGIPFEVVRCYGRNSGACLCGNTPDPSGHCVDSGVYYGA